MTEPLRYERRDRVAVLRLERERRNALDGPLIDALLATIERLAEDVELRAVILTGTDECFSSGADMRDAKMAATVRGPALAARAVMRRGQRLCRALEEMPQLTIAAVEGPVAGAGVALALACDFRVIGDGSALSLPEVAIGLNFGWNSIPRLVRLVGAARAKELVILGRVLDAGDAYAWGLANRVTARGGALAEALEIASRVASQPALAATLSKQAIDAYATALAWTASHADAEQALLCVAGGDLDRHGAHLHRRSADDE